MSFKRVSLSNISGKFVSAIDPILPEDTSVNDLGLIWFDTSTTTTVVKTLVKVAGVLTWKPIQLGTAPGSGDVGGGTNLTTVGSVPFVSASGILNRDSGLFWDNTNKRLGIGTTAPNNTLTVFNGVATTNGQLRLGYSDSYYWDIGRENLNTGRLVFVNVNNGSAYERVSILNSGNVGIGTTSPGEKLDVKGNLALVGSQTWAADSGLFIKNSVPNKMWYIGSLNTSLPGANASTDLSFERYNDSGVSLGAAVTVLRSSGNVGIGTTNPLTKLNVVETLTSSPRGILSSQFSTSTDGARVGFSKARGTEAAPTTVVSGDTLGRMMFRGYDGTNALEMGSIDVVVAGTVAATRVPTYMTFSTATDATPSVLTERIRIDAAGNINIYGTIKALTGDIRTDNGATGSPQVEFDQNGSGKAYIAYQNTGLYLDIFGGTNGTAFTHGNTGFGSTNPGSKITSTGDIFVTTSAAGVILTDSAGACWRIVVAPTTGLLSTTSVTPPTF